MFPSGPIVLVSDEANAELAGFLRARGNVLVNESSWETAPAAIKAGRPAALILDEQRFDPDILEPLTGAIAAVHEPYMPVLARASPVGAPLFSGALPIAASAAPERVLARLSWALRLRALHAGVLQYAVASGERPSFTLPSSPTQQSENATILVVGRGRNYRDLITAASERVSVISTLSVENAARFLCMRDIDGVLIGDGFAPRVLQAFAVALSQDPRFRDLPIGLIAAVQPSEEWDVLPNFERLGGGPAGDLIDYMLPLVHMHANAARLERELASIESDGMLDPVTGLFTANAFLRELERAVDEARAQRSALSLARFSFEVMPAARGTGDSAARQLIRLARRSDIAGRADDGSILLAFPNTGLGNAHALVRRIGSTLAGNLPGLDRQAERFDPAVTLAVFKPNDSVESLLARVTEPVAAAASGA
jgi:GGDEF domain-containing protein